MTAKRFNRVGGYVYDGEKCISHFEDVKHRDDIVNLLNELHEEKEQLQSRINDYDVALKTLQDLTERKLKENEHIKHTIKTMMENERTELGKSILKQLWEQIE